MGSQGIQGVQGISGLSGVGVAISVTDETTNATRYVGFATTTSGTINSINISSTRLTYNPSTSELFNDGSISIGATDSPTQKFTIVFNNQTDSLDFNYTP